MAMTERVYIPLREASEHLQAKGLTGQSTRLLRAAIARGRLAGAKDGRSWTTTLEALDAYEKGLWHVPSFEVVPDFIVLRRPRRTARVVLVKRQAAEESAKQALACLASVPRKSGERRPRRPKPEPKPEPKRYPEYEVLPQQEKRQRMRDYLDGKRVDCR